MHNPVTALLTFIVELQQKPREPISDNEWDTLLRMDADVAATGKSFPDVPQAGGEIKTVGFCRIPYLETLPGKWLCTSPGYESSINWRQAMHILERQFPREKKPTGPKRDPKKDAIEALLEKGISGRVDISETLGLGK